MHNLVTQSRSSAQIIDLAIDQLDRARDRGDSPAWRRRVAAGLVRQGGEATQSAAVSQKLNAAAAWLKTHPTTLLSRKYIDQRVMKNLKAAAELVED